MIHEIILGDCLGVMRGMAAGSVDCVVTSPPYYGLRDYGCAGQVGLEPSPKEYVAKMVEVFAEVRRVLKDDGTLWLNLGDSYNSGASNQNGGGLDANTRQGNLQRGRATRPCSELKPKNLLGIPWRVAFALQGDGWILRQDIIFSKPNPMPESVRDRCTKSHEYVFLLAKSAKYHYDADAIKEAAVNGSPGGGSWKHTAARGTGDKGLRCKQPAREFRNKRSVWTVTPKPFKGAHFAVMPEALVEPCVLAGCPVGGLVLDPFAGAATVGVVALRHGRRFVGVELNPDYCTIARERIASAQPLLAEVAS